MSKLVSIIVPCYNQAHFLSDALQSVLNQIYVNWECIIVNDGSPDNTEQVANEWCKKDKRFKYISKNNGGLSSARNAGIKSCDGEFILPLDSDDIIDSKFLEILVPHLVNDNSLAIVSCYTKFFSKKTSNVIHELKPKGDSFRNLLFENNLIATSLYRKSCWEEVGGYDENMKNGFEDWEFWIAITKSGWKYKVVEDFLFFYRKSKKSMLIDTLENHRISNMEYVFEKHKDLYKENYDNTLKYLFFLINMYRNTNLKIENSSTYKITKILSKPFKIFKK
ncbi:glycosyltransferase family 2 protein [Sabulilitoribacter multivorans]|uniref:Glycosyltransferase family 2 protein n=1 Tax=Flaviramulus multivorans TaxID=1304750 RepID=A0ABS9IHT8_9FLAO|nr:glycosyltransferase family A protein [Flaviramulus multivorans]MCF7560321.1 glycosyltransferase family 2 protein [Flaviramulus multivorans]